MKKSSVFYVLVCFGALSMSACTETKNEGTGGAGGEGQWGNGGQGGSSTSTGGGNGQGGSSSSASRSGAMPDPYEAARQACVDHINTLRATKSLPPLQRWKEAEPCLDQQATWDQENNNPHGSWGMGLYPSCNGSGQNECLGHGPDGITQCLDQMWDEKNLAGCSGCDACSDAYNPSCPNCDFFGQQTGDVCGHYVNMSAKYFSKVACGFSPVGGWNAINFQ
jgi:hypothetical protein